MKFNNILLFNFTTSIFQCKVRGNTYTVKKKWPLEGLVLLQKLFFLLMIVNSTKIAYSQNTWQLAKDKKGIKVFVKKVAGSDFYAFKAVMSVKVDKEEIIKILKDVNNYPKWHAYTASTKLIEQSKYEQLFVMETDFPWPYANECMIYTMVFPKNERNDMQITLTGAPAKTECKYSFEYASGYILLESENTNTEITYYFHSNPSQKIPAWLTNPQIHDLPYQTFVSLRNRLEKNE